MRNRFDGTVEALFAGPEDAVREMVDACWDGPPAARVEDIEEQEDFDLGAIEQGGPGFSELGTV